jgi:hypothetical protein
VKAEEVVRDLSAKNPIGKIRLVGLIVKEKLK